MEKTLLKKALPKWIEKCDSFRIYAPVNKDDQWHYDIIENPADVQLDHPNTVLSPKKIIFPLREVFFEFRTDDKTPIEIDDKLPDDPPTIVFGVRPCDARAITLTDKVFEGDFKDPYYLRRRDKTTIVGLVCKTPPSANCFCRSVKGSPASKEGCDVLMTDIGDKYHVMFLNKKGQKLIEKAKDLLKNPTDKDKKETKKVWAEAEKKTQRQIQSLETIPDKLKDMFDSPLWDEESLHCIRCGICTYLCPTCHCFDISDEVLTSSPLKGKRVRTWDNCQFPDFTMHSSGHNPRPDKASRLRQRIMHKFQYFVSKYNTYQCTGCGRCITKCPVGIDIIDVLEKVRDYGS
jgi:ferredoxin